MNPLKMQEMLEQARHMQDQMQEKLSHTVVEASSGGGAVTVKMNGQKQVLQLKIDPSAVLSLSSSPGDVEMLEDLVTAAFNEAGRRADEAIKSNLSGMLGGLIRARKPLTVSVVLVDCLIYRGLRCSLRRHAAPSSDRDPSATTRVKKAPCIGHGDLRFVSQCGE